MTYEFTIKEKSQGYLLSMKQTTALGLVEREGVRNFDNPDATLEMLQYLRDIFSGGVHGDKLLKYIEELENSLEMLFELIDNDMSLSGLKDYAGKVERKLSLAEND